MRRADQFVAAIRGGVRRSRASLVVHVASGPGSDRLVGFVVSKEVGNAVTRNLVKRRLRAIAAERLGALAPGVSVVVRALPASATACFADLRHDFIDAVTDATKRARARNGA
jgi:ribonuclease P protein component